ncbi:MAG: aminoglycoside phosphotransferase family protein [candidate division KSB1 bacterium]
MLNLPEAVYDEYLPALPTATNTDAMCEVFQRELPDFAARKYRMIDISIKQFQHRPGRKAELIYSLRYWDEQAQVKKRQFVFIVLLPQEAAEAQYETARQRQYAQTEAVPSVHFFPRLGMVLWSFPNDPKMKHLYLVVETASLRDILSKHWDDLRLTPDHRLCGVETDISKYAPQDRCTCKHTLALEHRGRPEELVLFSKTFSPKTFAEPIYELMQALWRAPVCQTGILITPEPLFYDPALNTIFCRGVPGGHALDLLDRVDLNDVTAQTGAALAGLQRSDLPLGNFRARDGEMTGFEEGMQILVRYDGGYRSRLEAMCEALWERLPDLPPLETVPVHGAFRLPQLLLVENKIALLDFDGFLAGDPMLDVSSFIAHLFYLVVKGEVTRAQYHSAAAHFTRAYAEAAPWGLPREVLQWYLALTLIAKQAKKCIRLARDNHAVKVGQLVDFAEAVLRGEELPAV